jgi:hypothetical protein
MRRGLLIVVGLLAIALGVAEGGRIAPELIPLDPKSADGPDFLQSYHGEVRDALLGPKLHADCEAVVFPSFEREWAVYVTTGVGRREVVYMVLKEQLRGTEHNAADAAETANARANLRGAVARGPKNVLRYSAPLGEPVARKLHRVWEVMLNRAREPAKDEWGADGTSYFVFERGAVGTRAGTTWSPDPRTPAGQLAAIVQLLKDHAQKTGAALTASEAELSARSKELLHSLR